jgi:AraC-like DNA-binding protein
MEISQKDVQLSPVADMVKMFWQVIRDNEGFNHETIIPKGSAEVIFNLFESDAIPAKIGKKRVTVPRCFISGYNTVPIHLQIPKRQAFFGVFLNPTALQKLFGIPAREYANDCIDLTLIDKSTDSLWRRLAEEQTFDSRIDIFTNWITKRVTAASKREKMFDDFLTSPSGQSLSASSLSDLLCYSPRHLSRKLNDLTGMNLEQTLMFKRYVQALTMMHHSSMPLTAIAHACDFTDQSHFSKTFRSYADMKPTEYRAMKSNVSGHIFKNVR